jgi:hypothetical protein
MRGEFVEGSWLRLDGDHELSNFRFEASLEHINFCVVHKVDIREQLLAASHIVST